MKRLHRKYNYPTRESFAQMTDEDAFQIQKNLIQIEFPFFYTKSLQFALFKVCPSSSSCCKTTNIIADLWHPYHFADPDQDKPVLKRQHLLQALHRHKRPRPGVRGAVSIRSTWASGYCAYSIPPQWLPGLGHDSR
jgi:hypothetical protein